MSFTNTNIIKAQVTLVKDYGVIFLFLPSICRVNKYQGFYGIFSIEKKGTEFEPIKIQQKKILINGTVPFLPPKLKNITMYSKLHPINMAKKGKHTNDDSWGLNTKILSIKHVSTSKLLKLYINILILIHNYIFLRPHLSLAQMKAHIILSWISCSILGNCQVIKQLKLHKCTNW